MSNKTKYRLLTIKEAAAEFPGLTAFRIRTLIKSGELPHIYAGRKYLICDHAINDYIFQNAVCRDIIPPQDNRVADTKGGSGNG
jgi:excisionase family DNA binding protein